jgi:hypothetical protein
MRDLKAHRGRRRPLPQPGTGRRRRARRYWALLRRQRNLEERERRGLEILG